MAGPPLSDSPLALPAADDLSLLEVSAAVCDEAGELYWNHADAEFRRRGQSFTGSYQRLLEAGLVELVGDGWWRLSDRGRSLAAMLRLPDVPPIGPRHRRSPFAG